MPKSKDKSQKKLDYSVWDHIEVSDDEDDTHPNIDTPSLFRWRHQARMERAESSKIEKDDFEKRKKEHMEKYDVVRVKFNAALKNIDSGVPISKDLKEEWGKLQDEHRKILQEEEELIKKDRNSPWNVDTICKEGKSRSIVNKLSNEKSDAELTDEEKLQKMKDFLEKNKELVKKYGMLSKFADSERFLTDHPELVCDESANQLVVWCIDLEMEDKHSLMEHVSHQAIVLNFILELGRSLKKDPRSCVRPFFTRVKAAAENGMPGQAPPTGPEKQYLDSFQEELIAFRERISKRAKERVEEAVQQYQEEERKKRIGPGGLDPQDVFDSLPKALQDCFEKRDIPMLQKVLLEMDPQEAQLYMKRCTDSGLWVPGAGATGGDAGAEGDEEEEYDEPVSPPAPASSSASSPPESATSAPSHDSPAHSPPSESPRATATASATSTSTTSSTSDASATQ